MDPITAFATIVSLIADFVSHRTNSEDKDFAAFTAWLAENRHDEIKNMLDSNAETTVSIKALLTDSREEILVRLTSLDRALATIASGMEPFRDIARLAYPSAELSDQAYGILEQFYDSGATTVLEVKYLSDPTELAYIDAPANGSIAYTEPRFVEDDLATLVELGLLGVDYNGNGRRMLKFKRSAAELVEQRRRA